MGGVTVVNKYVNKHYQLTTNSNANINSKYYYASVNANAYANNTATNGTSATINDNSNCKTNVTLIAYFNSNYNMYGQLILANMQSFRSLINTHVLISSCIIT